MPSPSAYLPPDPLADEDQLARAMNRDIGALSDNELAAELVHVTNALAAEVRAPSGMWVTIMVPPYSTALPDYLEDRLSRLRREQRSRKAVPRAVSR